MRLMAVGGGSSLESTTNADGTYEFSGVDVGNYLVQLIIDGDVAAEEPATVEADETTTVDLVAPLPSGDPDPGSLQGDARWADHSGPVEGVEIEITRGATTLRDTTGPSGAYAFDGIEAGFWELTATYDGDVVLTGPINVPEGDVVWLTIDVPLPVIGLETGKVDGTVTWDDGTPVDGETVRLVAVGGGPSLDTTTNADGTYEFSDVEVGDYLVQVIIDGDIAAEQTATVEADQTTTVDLVAPLSGGTPDPGSLHGEARWSDLSGPVDGVEIEIIRGATTLRDTTGPSGAYAFDGIEAGFWNLTATYDGDVILTGPINVPEGDVVWLAIDVPLPVSGPETGTVDGTVTWEAGTQVDGETVRLVPVGGGANLDTTTNADGTYQFTGVEVGDYLVQVIIDGDIAAEQTATVEADQTTTVDLVAPLSGGTPDPGSLHGEARWSDLSGPVEGVEIEIIRGATTLRDTTGPSGAYAFDGIEAGFWNLTATYDGDVILTGPINVPEGDVVWLAIDVPLPVS